MPLTVLSMAGVIHIRVHDIVWPRYVNSESTSMD